MDRYRTIAFTGHRLERLHSSQWLWLVTETRLVLLDATGAGVTRFVVGLDDGFGLLAADMVLEARRQEASLSLITALPFPGPGARRAAAGYGGAPAAVDAAGQD